MAVRSADGRDKDVAAGMHSMDGSERWKKKPASQAVGEGSSGKIDGWRAVKHPPRFARAEGQADYLIAEVALRTARFTALVAAT
jgi:hypothetical protein